MDHQRIEILHWIQRLSQGDDAGNTNAIQDLKQKYNLIIEREYRDSPAKFWDIIEVFPPEIWIRIIQESLPEQNYPSALLLLTMVSTKWQHAIISTPILWAYIQISGLDEDSFATIRTLAHLSRETALCLTLYMPVYYEEEVVDSLLANLLTRLQRVVILADVRIRYDMDLERSYFNVESHRARAVLSRPSRNASRNLDTNAEQHSLGYMEHEVTEIEALVMMRSPRITAIRNWWIGWEKYRVSGLVHQFEGVKAVNRPEEEFQWTLFNTLDIPLIRFSERYIPDGQTPKPGDCVSISNLRRFCLPRGPLPMRTLAMVAPQLLDLELGTSPFQFYNILKILTSATRLNKLSLALNDSTGYYLPAQLIPVNAAIPSLRILALDLKGELPLLESTWIQLIPILGTLYPQVEDVSFNFLLTREITSVVFFDFLSHLRNLRFLSLDGLHAGLLPKEPHAIDLMALEELEVSHPGFLRWLRAPQLLALKSSWVKEYDGVGLDYATVRNLYVKGRDEFFGPLAFTEGSLPSLTCLTVHNLGFIRPIPSSFRFLTTITMIGTTIAMTDIPTNAATSLCFSILYYPEDLPSLHSIKFIGSAPEWDVLFTMLERRNFLLSSEVSRIHSLVLPNIPEKLHSTLAALLRGLYTRRPANEDVSFTGVVEALFDTTISGCFACIRDMLGPCDRPVYLGEDLRMVDDLRRSIYSTLKDSIPADLGHEIVHWIDRREKEIQGMQAWQSSRHPTGYSRYPICIKQARSVPVEITEHDV